MGEIKAINFLNAEKQPMRKYETSLYSQEFHYYPARTYSSVNRNKNSAKLNTYGKVKRF